jgi:23S rRNA pseudouridine1911/1915/1917 synthase
VSGGLQVLFEDEHCLAVVKQAGQFVQGSWSPPGEQTLEQAVRQHLDPDAPGSAYLGIVHRLDRPVSGVLIWAKTAKAARRLAAQFERRRVEKEYWAIVEATPESVPGESLERALPLQAREGTWTDWLTAAGVSGVVRAVAPGTAGARAAVTRYCFSKAVKVPPGCQWLRLWPETGRTHQLRAQTSIRGMPIVGDATYGSAYGFPRGIALHARALRILHPILQTQLIFTATLPASWTEAGILVPGSEPSPEPA